MLKNHILIEENAVQKNVTEKYIEKIILIQY